MVALKNNRGFSLVETMTVIGIVAIMGMFAVPPMISWLQNKGLNSAARDLYSNMRKAQSIAVKNNRNCAISFNNDGSGYTVYVDSINSNSSTEKYIYNSGEQKIAEVLWSQYRNVQFVSANFTANIPGQPTVVFRPNLIPIHAGTVVLKNSISPKIDVVVSTSGNISLKQE